MIAKAVLQIEILAIRIMDTYQESNICVLEIKPSVHDGHLIKARNLINYFNQKVEGSKFNEATNYLINTKIQCFKYNN